MFRRHLFLRRGLIYKCFFVLCLVLLIGIIGYTHFFNDLEQVRLYFQHENYKKALQIIKRNLKKNPQDLYAMDYLARIYLVYALKQEINLEGEKDNNYLGLAVKNFENVLIIYQKNKKTFFVDKGLYFYLGFAYFLQQRYDFAFKFLAYGFSKFADAEELLLAFPNRSFGIQWQGQLIDFSPYALLGYVAYQTGRYQYAVHYFKQALKKSNKKLGVYYLYLGMAYQALDRSVKSMQAFQEVIAREERVLVRSQAYFLIGLLHFKGDDYRNSEKYIRQSQRIRPSADGFYTLGLIEQKKGRISFALNQWRKALRLDADHQLSRLRVMRFGSK